MTDDWQEQMLRHVQFIALGTIVGRLLTEHFKQAPDPGAAADAMRAEMEALASLMTFEVQDPAMSDLAAQEYRDTLIRHIDRARALATGEPFDPTSFQRSSPEPKA